MKRTIVAIAALGVVAGACSSGRSSQREETETTQAQVEQVEPKSGVLASVDGQRLMLEPADDAAGEPLLFERTTRSVVMRDGSEIAWEELTEGDVVRVTWDRGIFGPDRVAQVEVLEGEEAEEVREEMESGVLGTPPNGVSDDDSVGRPLEPRPVNPGPGTPTGPGAPGPGAPGTVPPASTEPAPGGTGL